MKYKHLIIYCILTCCIVTLLLLYVKKDAQVNQVPQETLTYQEVFCDPYLDVWHERYRVITHALGGIDGKSYTNSLDALDVNYRKGKRLFEVDFNYTSDGQIILTHDFQETENNLVDYPDGYVPTYEEFMNNRIYYKYHPTSALQLLQYMSEHEQMYLVSDIKYENPETITAILNDIVQLAKDNGITEVLDRFIIQFYFEQNYYDIQAIHPFKNYIYSLYAEKNKDFESAKNFCIQNDIAAVLMRSSWVKDETTLQVFNENGIKVYVYTLNNLTNIYERMTQGVYGFVSDYVYEKDLYIKDYYALPNIYHLPIDINFNKLYD